MKQAIVFDFDGVILDTETPDYQSWANVFAAHNVQLDREVWSPLIGSVEYDIPKYLEAQTGIEIDRFGLSKGRHAVYIEMVEANPVMPGVVDFLEEATRLELGLAIASASRGGWAQHHLKRLGLSHYFSEIFTGDDVANAKPHPDIYLAAVAALNIAPEQAIAIEDSPTGITAAKRAGVFCLAVPNSMTRDLDVGHADMRVDSLGDTTVEALLRQIDSIEASRR
ncbi:MAG TPA: HAD-IA family hydrolase [SAR202 cluster bacterium]|nr:HAD-IA family hydrolase [SAR202 cluster bacterium]HJO81370.1 HAD-IA family hydrolase [SAR202 cluster bacterium]